MSDFKAFKQKMSGRNPSDLANAFATKTYEDDRFWKLNAPVGAEEASAIIRFLPQKDPDKTSIYKYFHFSFKHPETGQYYIENCLNTFGDNVADPCSEENRRLWNLIPGVGIDSEYYKNICRARKRKIGYLANILVIQDKKCPQNNGKVFLYKFGSKILEKINNAALGNPELGKPPFDPMNFDGGANFALIMQKDTKSGYYQYDRSEFGNCSPIPEIQQEDVFNSLYDLETALEFKSYDQLKDRLNTVLGVSQFQPTKDESQHMETELHFAPPAPVVSPKTATKKVVLEETKPLPTNSTTEFDDDDDEAFLNALIED